MSLPFSAQELQQNIRSDLSICESLLILLKEEQAALKQREVDVVGGLLDKKVPMLEKLDQSSKVRASWAAAAQRENNESGWTGLIAECSQTAHENIGEEWKKLKSLYNAVRSQNEINGKLLSRNQNTISRVLDVMRGKTAAPNLYTATGYSSSQAHSNNLGEA